jgi:hypothetical protein
MLRRAGYHLRLKGVQIATNKLSGRARYVIQQRTTNCNRCLQRNAPERNGLQQSGRGEALRAVPALPVRIRVK